MHRAGVSSIRVLPGGNHSAKLIRLAANLKPEPAKYQFHNRALLSRRNHSSTGARRNVRQTSTTTTAMYNAIDEAKKLAAYKAVDEHVKSGDVVGVGSGSTIVFAVDRLAERIKANELKDINCIPTSFQAKQLIIDNGLNLSTLEIHPKINVSIDGADEADKDLTLIKGGGGCLAQEKVVASNADYFVVVADQRKRQPHLGTFFEYVPIEVLELAYKPLQLKIEKQFGGSARLRMAKAKAGPVVTDNGNLILDWVFNLEELKTKLPKANGDKEIWQEVDQRLCRMPGVVETGLFIGMAKIGYFGAPDGTVETVKSSD